MHHARLHHARLHHARLYHARLYHARLLRHGASQHLADVGTDSKAETGADTGTHDAATRSFIPSRRLQHVEASLLLVAKPDNRHLSLASECFLQARNGRI